MYSIPLLLSQVAVDTAFSDTTQARQNSLLSSPDQVYNLLAREPRDLISMLRKAYRENPSLIPKPTKEDERMEEQLRKRLRESSE